MKGATQFGKTIMELLEKNKLQQKDLADEFGVSLGTISNYINGKTIPEMDFIAKCVKKFGLKKKELVEFILYAFWSTSCSHRKIIIDTRFIDPKQIITLAQFLTVSVLYPRRPFNYKDDEIIRRLRVAISECFKVMDEETEFHPPPDDEKPED